VPKVVPPEFPRVAPPGTRPQDRRERPEDSGDGDHLRPGPGRAPAEEQAERTQQTPDQQVGENQWEPPARGVREQQRHSQPAPVRQCRGLPDRRIAALTRRGLAADHGPRRHHDPAARGVHPPAQVDVVTEGGPQVVQPPEGVPRLSAYQGSGCRNGQDVVGLVALPLVELRTIDADVPVTGAVHRHPGFEQTSVGPAVALGPDLPDGRRGIHPLEELRQSIRVRGGVVGEQPQPLGVIAVVEGERSRDSLAAAGLAGNLDHLR
jgi:hypothetical protein